VVAEVEGEIVLDAVGETLGETLLDEVGAFACTVNFSRDEFLKL
jgi:hypothetical protein